MTVRRRYKDGDEWKDASGFSPDDLLPLAELAREAYAWIRNRRSADREGRREQESEAIPA